MNTKDNNSFPLTDTILIGITSITCYLAAYLNEAGSYSYYNFPLFFIDVSFTDALFVGSLLYAGGILMLCAIFIFARLSSKLAKMRSTGFISYVYVSALILPTSIGVVIFISSHSPIPYFLTATIIIVILIYSVTVWVNSRVKVYADAFKDVDVNKISAINLMIKFIKIDKIYIALMSLLVIPASSFIIGYRLAQINKTYLIIRTGKTSAVVIKKVDEYLITAPFIGDSLIGNFSYVKLDSQISFKYELLGPLKPAVVCACPRPHSIPPRGSKP